MDFSYPGGPFLPERGTIDAPYNTLNEGVVAVSRGGTIKIRSGSTGERPSIGKPMSIEAVGGPVNIGQ